MKKLKNNKVLPYCMEEAEGTRRQDLPQVYKRSSAVYVQRRDLLMRENRLYGDYVVGHMVPKERYIDIDTELEWLQAEYMLERLKKKGNAF